MNVGDRVKYDAGDGWVYLGTIIAKKGRKLYKVSVVALGIVIDSDGSNISVISE